MFLNRFRKGLLSINKVAIISLVENRFSQLPLPDFSNVALFDVRKCEKIWKIQRGSDKLYKHLHECFSKNEGSSVYIANVMRHACDHGNCTPELVYNLITAYRQYTESNSIKSTITKEQKTEILNSVLYYKNYQLLKLACEVFEIAEEQKSIFKEFITTLLHQEKLAEAAYCISVLKLQEEYPIEKIVLLLLHEGKWHAAMAFLKDCPDLQLETARLLDGLLDSKVNSVNTSVNVKHVYRALTVLVRAFKISPVECKNLHYIRSKGAINLLVKRREQQSILEATWEEMVMKVIGENDNLKEFLLFKLMVRGDKETAVKMKEKLQMHDFDLESITVDSPMASLKSASEEIGEAEDSSDEDDNGHLTFNLSSSDIKFVNTREGYFDCIADLSQNYNMVGIDSEWKPQFGLSQIRLALMQIAAHDKVYILDMLALTECLDSKDWDKLMDDIFSSQKIIKLGCGITQDIQMIVEGNRGTKGKALRFSHILDMAVFYQKLQEVYPEEMGRDEETRNLKGLSNLCKIILGKPLNKEERLCDWEKRPLTDSQLEYAALDAHCLLQIYDEMKKLSYEKNINFDHLAKVAIILTTSLWKPRKKFTEVKRGKDNQKYKPVPICQFKVAVQPELEIHIKKLKQLGADVLILQQSDKASDAALISKTQDRIIVCLDDFRRKVYNISSDVPCFIVFNDNETHMSIPRIFQKFNVKPSTERLFSRCEVCNNEEGVQLSPEDMHLIKELDSKTEIVADDDESASKYPEGSLQRTIYDMKKAGVKLKLDKHHSISSSSVFLCIKCGHVQ